MSAEIEKLRAQGRAGLVGMALHQLAVKCPTLTIDPRDYAISIWYRGEVLQARMRRLIRYAVKGANYEYDIMITLVRGTVLPFDDERYNDKFFVPTADQQRVIDLVARVTGVREGRYADHEISVSEDAEFIFVQIQNDVSFLNLFLDKVTGEEKMPSIHGSYVPAPIVPGLEQEHDPWQEITE